MKATELMLGDLVTFKECQNNKNPVIIKIWEINAGDEAFAIIGNPDILDEIIIDDEIVGIPLTPEILEKNGFVYNPNSEKKDDGWWEWRNFGVEFGNEYVDITFRDNYMAVYDLEIFKGSSSVYLRLNYVHQLQHTLRLCGINKEIKL